MLFSSIYHMEWLEIGENIEPITEPNSEDILVWCHLVDMSHPQKLQTDNLVVLSMHVFLGV